jgi:predicted anti-sigma-YlaC factor YlaD
MTDRAPHCTASRDPGLREAVGAYLLGALEPAESDRVAAHLADCSSCRAEYGELIELLPLLASVTEGEAVNGPVRPEPAVLGRVLETTSQLGADRQGYGLPGDDFAAPRRHKRARRPVRRTPRTRIALGVACVVLAAAGSGIGVMMSSSHSAGPVTIVAGSWSAKATAQPYRTATTETEITASVEVYPASWGSTIQLKMASVPKGYTCSMVVIGRNGQRQEAGNWKAKDGVPFTVSGAVSLVPSVINSIDVVLPNGTTLLSLKNPH